MRLRYIEMFQAVLQAETLTGAARLLNISQPAATKLLQQAERQLGFPLFVRVRGRFRLTPEAMLLRQRVERIADELTELRRLAGNLRPSEHETLRLVSTPTLANVLLPDVVTRLRKSYRSAQIDLLTQHTREMTGSLLLRESDVGLTLQRMDHPGLHCEPLCEGAVMAIAARGHWRPAEIGTPLEVGRLAGAAMIGIAVRDDLGRRLHAFLDPLSPPPNITTWVQTYQVARSLVAAGHGLALVDPFTARGAGDDGVRHRPVSPAIPVTLYAVHRVDTPLSPLQAAALEHARAAAAAIVAPPPAARERRTAD